MKLRWTYVLQTLTYCKKKKKINLTAGAILKMFKENWAND